MTRVGFHKSVRMFRKFSEETLRRSGGSPMGREGVAALAAFDAVLRAERLLDGTLLEPLAAFTNLLQSAQLPPEFGDYSFGDALLAFEEAHAELRQNQQQRWEFDPQPPPEKLSALRPFWPEPGPPAAPPELFECVLEAMRAAKPGAAVVVGSLRAPLPLAKLAAHFERLTLNDLDLAALEELVRRDIPENLRGKVRLERYDLTGTYVAFADEVAAAVAKATEHADAEQALLELLQSYDVGAGSAGLTDAEGRADLAVSALVLPTLARGYGACVAQALAARDWDQASVGRPPLAPALELLSRLVEQHHIHALVRRAERALLACAVSEVELASEPARPGNAAGQPRDLLGVERLAERLPERAQVKREWSWEWRRTHPGNGKRSLLTLVEAVLI
jgi:hypothetical protein